MFPTKFTNRVRFYVTAGSEIRGLMIRLYPTIEQDEALRGIESDLRIRWNWLVKQTEEVISARRAYALRNGLVPSLPEKPNCDGMTPHETRDAWASFRAACREWAGLVHEATKDVPCCEWRPSLREEIARFGFKYDYQFFGSSMFDRVRDNDLDGQPESVRPCSHAYQALVKNYFTKAEGMRRKKFRRTRDPMPLQVRSGDCFTLGEYGSRGKGGRNFYDCQIAFNGLKIRGRLPGRAPWGRVLQGVSITRQADGWWASIKQEVPARELPNAVLGSVIGIDAGLDVIAAMSDGTLVDNPRVREYVDMVAGRQASGKDASRMQQRASRHTRHVLYNDVVKALANVETIKVEKLNGRIGQMGGSPKISTMRKMVSMLKDRYGDRVVEVNPAYTSQTCSQCGVVDKEAWSGLAPGKMRTCPACGYKQHCDVNAAQNIAARGLMVDETRNPLAKPKRSGLAKRNVSNTTLDVAPS